MKAAITTKYTHHVHCPHCNAEADTVSHLYQDHLPRSFGPWYCDACGGAYRGQVNGPNDVDIEPLARAKHSEEATLVLLRLDPQTAPVYLIVKGRYIDRDLDESPKEAAEKDRYFYEEHTCPVNYLGCEAVISDGDTDPHGLFTYVKTVPASVKDAFTTNGDDSTVFDEDEFYAEYFPEVLGTPPTIDVTANASVNARTLLGVIKEGLRDAENSNLFEPNNKGV